MKLGQRLFDRRHRHRRWSERVLVGGQFDDVVRGQIQLARDFLDRTARLIRRHVREGGVDGEHGRSGWRVTWLHGYMVTWLHGYMVTWLHGCMVAWLHGCYPP